MSSKEGLGTINWWGFTPALDLCKSNIIISAADEVNILLVGCGDARHILKTISKLYKRNLRKINFYLYESSIAIYARQILQIVISLIPLCKLGLQDKVESFLELYGNILVRQQSMELVRTFSTEMINLVTNPDSCKDQIAFLELKHLKFKDTDILEHVFKIWRHSDERSFDGKMLWDLRLRKYLGTRYDSIPNVFDWDCSMTLHERGAEIINSKEYCKWRENGLAFELRDANYEVSNRTLSSGRLLVSSKVEKHVQVGYWGDIVCSPYLGFGIRCSKTEFFKKMNNQYIVGSVRISEYNITKIMHEIAHKTKYAEVEETPIQEKDTRKTMTIEEVDEENEVEDEIKENPPKIIETNQDEEKSEKGNLSEITADLLKIFSKYSSSEETAFEILPITLDISYLQKKSQFEKLFDMIYLSSTLIGDFVQCGKTQVSEADGDIAEEKSNDSCSLLRKLLSDQGGCIIVETPQFIVDLNNKQLATFNDAIQERIENDLSLKKCPDETMSKTGHVLFKKH